MEVNKITSKLSHIYIYIYLNRCYAGRYHSLSLKIFHSVQTFNRTEIDISTFVEFSSSMRICFFFSPNPMRQQNIKLNKNKPYSVPKRLNFILFAWRVFKAQDAMWSINVMEGNQTHTCTLGSSLLIKFGSTSTKTEDFITKKYSEKSDKTNLVLRILDCLLSFH